MGDLNPTRMGKGLYIYSVISLLALGMAYLGSLTVGQSFHQTFVPFLYADGSISIIFLIMSILFSINSMSFRFQKTELTVASIAPLKMSFDLAVFF
ncbi:MAG: hypothetical protein ACE3JK_03660 [Sporolactobacillus sp.]